MAKAVVKNNEQLPATQFPDYLAKYQGETGVEDMSSQDINIPRIKIGQSMTPEVKDKLAEEGDLIHSITHDVICKQGESIIMIPIAWSKEYILWRDRKDGGGIMARARRAVLSDGNVVFAWDKPNQEFEHKIEGKIFVKWKTGRYIEEDGLGEWGSQIPGDKTSGMAATVHHNYVVLIPSLGELMAALSLSRTAVKKAKDLNALLKMNDIPIFAKQIELSTVKEVTDDNPYYNYSFRPAGLLQDEALFNRLATLHQHLRDRGINVDFSDVENRSDSGGDAF